MMPDLTILGKVIGGGLPAAAYGGSRDADGADRARRRRLPGRHAVREPARHGGRPRDARQLDEQAYAAAAGDDGRRSPTGCARRRGDGAGPGRSATGPAHRVLLAPSAVARLRGRAALRPRAPTPPGAARCWRAASIRRRRSSRPGSLAGARRRAVERTLEAAAAAFEEVAMTRPRWSGSRDGCASEGGLLAARCSRRARRPRGDPGSASSRRPARAARSAPTRYALPSRRSSRAPAALRARRACSTPDDADLALLAGDQLYALGLARLAALGDLDGGRRARRRDLARARRRRPPATSELERRRLGGRRDGDRLGREPRSQAPRRPRAGGDAGRRARVAAGAARRPRACRDAGACAAAATIGAR